MGLFRRADGSEQSVDAEFVASGASGDEKHFVGSGRVPRLPARVDLRPHMTPIENQERTSSCVANAVAGAYEYLFKRYQGVDEYDVSRLFIYYNARSLHQAEGRDQGTSLKAAILGLMEYGACSEETWPFDAELVNTEPDEDAYDEASSFLIEDVAVVPADLTAWKMCLAEGYPIIFAISLFRSFDQLRRGVVPMPSSKETTREAHGAHAMLCVGYSDPDQVFIVRNSWGSGWGEQGYCYIPYAYLSNPKFYCGEPWLIRQVEELELDEELWDDDDTPMLEAVETEFGMMSDEEFSDLVYDAGDVPVETRIALLMVAAFAADEEVGEDEVLRAAGFLEHILEVLGADFNEARDILVYASELYDSEACDDLIQESVDLLGEHLSQEGLAALWQQVFEVADADELTEEEDDFLYWLLGQWQIEPDEEEYDEDEEEWDE